MKNQALALLYACILLMSTDCLAPEEVAAPPAPENVNMNLTLSYSGHKEIYKGDVRIDSLTITDAEYAVFLTFSHCESIQVKNSIAYWFTADYVAGCSTSTSSDSIDFSFFAMFDTNLTVVTTLDASQSVRFPGTLAEFSGEHSIVYCYNGGILTTQNSLDPFTNYYLDTLLAENDSSVVLRMKFLAKKRQ
jgi:hypothetical protein